MIFSKTGIFRHVMLMLHCRDVCQTDTPLMKGALGMSQLPIEESSQPAQRSPRQHRLLRAHMVSDDGKSQEITIRNISAKGIGGVLSKKTEKVGDKVTIFLAHGSSFTGVLRWIKGKAFGMKLDFEVSTATLDHLVTSKRTNPAPEAGNDSWEVSRFYRAYASHIPRADPSRLRRI